VPSSLDKIGGEKGSIFSEVKGCIVFRLFCLSDEPGTGRGLKKKIIFLPLPTPLAPLQKNEVFSLDIIGEKINCPRAELWAQKAYTHTTELVFIKLNPIAVLLDLRN
jgi:hypothetical protein